MLFGLISIFSSKYELKEADYGHEYHKSGGIHYDFK